MLGSADPAQPPGESQRSRQPAPLSPVLQSPPEPASQCLRLLGACKKRILRQVLNHQGRASAHANLHFFLIFLSSTRLQLKPLANKLCQPLGVRNKSASIFRMYTVLHTFQLQNSKCIWMEILSPAGTTKVVFFQWLDQSAC